MNTITAIALILVTVVACVSAEAASAPSPVVFQPTDWVAEMGLDFESYLAELDRLAQVLAEETFASQRIHAKRGWNAWVSKEFSAYVQGLLASSGYPSVIVESDREDGSTYAWLLVSLPLSEEPVWVPIVPTPPLGDRQMTLGHVALESGRSLDDPAFDSLFMTYDRIVELAANQAPSATIAERPGVRTHERELFRVDRASDPDGSIVLYVWDFGDGTVVSTTSSRIQHRYTSGGTYILTLTVVDNRGATASHSMEISVSRDCGC